MEKTDSYQKSIDFLLKYNEKAKSSINKFEDNRYKVYLTSLVDNLAIREK
jgi:geranylgeranyl pyrophosphate synthase